MKITEIQAQKKNKNRYSLFIDNEFYCGVHEDVLVNLGLRKNMEFDESFIKDILQEENLAKAKSDALHYVSYRMRSRDEIIKKLESLDYDQATIDSTLSFLDEYRFMDDLAFARAFIGDKTRLSRHSLKRVKYDLKTKGVQKHIIDKAAESFHTADLINLKKLLPSKYEKISLKNESDYIKKQKTLAFFGQKGFLLEDIKYILDLYLKNELDQIQDEDQ